jgi:2-haloacid dehalogenase
MLAGSDPFHAATRRWRPDDHVASDDHFDRRATVRGQVLMTRREFVAVAGGAAAATTFARPLEVFTASLSAASSRVKALAFDAFPIFDPRPALANADAMFPGTGLAEEWRTRQFEYTWLRIAAQRYADFWQVTEDALVFATKKLELTLSQEQRLTLMNGYLELNPWPDVMPALSWLRQSGLRLAFLSNFTQTMLDANIKHGGLNGLFEQVISTDRARTYKPDPRAYQLGVDGLKLTRQEILFVAFAGWDAAGAKQFGYPTFWLNRLKLPAEELGVVPDRSSDTLADLQTFLT